VYPDPRVETFINGQYVPVKIHIKEQPQVFERFGVQWTPTMQVVDSDGTKRHQFEGFLPPEDFLAQLKLGLAQSAFARQQWKEAERLYGNLLSTLPDSDAAAEALYWQGVSRYKSSGDPAALQQTAEAFKTRYTASTWAKKASVWTK
jgi:thioredoxin-like negative regulator of GroEL